MCAYVNLHTLCVCLCMWTHVKKNTIGLLFTKSWSRAFSYHHKCNYFNIYIFKYRWRIFFSPVSRAYVFRSVATLRQRTVCDVCLTKCMWKDLLTHRLRIHLRSSYINTLTRLRSFKELSHRMHILRLSFVFYFHCRNNCVNNRIPRERNTHLERLYWRSSFFGIYINHVFCFVGKIHFGHHHQLDH